MTFKPIIGTKPFKTTGSKSMGICSRPKACAPRNRTTAIMSCMHRKKRGTFVEFRTHLFLRSACSMSAKRRGTVIDLRHDHL